MSQIPVTAEGKRKLHEELTVLEAKVPVIQRAIAEAREKGDLKENAEYHSAREDLGMLQGRISELRLKIANAVVVDESQIDRDAIAFGAIVDLEDLSDGSVEEWQLVGEGEDDALDNKLLTTSPMGQAMIGKRIGDEVVVQAPIGEIRFKVAAIRY